MDKSAEPGRELLAHQRQQEDLRQSAMRSRAEAELHENTDSAVEAQARQALADQRLDQDHTQATMLERSEEELQ